MVSAAKNHAFLPFVMTYTLLTHDSVRSSEIGIISLAGRCDRTLTIMVG
jgi:hypothetical protein